MACPPDRTRSPCRAAGYGGRHNKQGEQYISASYRALSTSYHYVDFFVRVPANRVVFTRLFADGMYRVLFGTFVLFHALASRRSFSLCYYCTGKVDLSYKCQRRRSPSRGISLTKFFTKHSLEHSPLVHILASQRSFHAVFR